MQASTPWNDVAFSFSERDRHLGIRPVSQLNTWPVVSPVNASRRPSRDAAHHSGSGRLATPYPVKDLHLLFFASLSWRTPSWVIRVGSGLSAFGCGHGFLRQGRDVPLGINRAYRESPSKRLSARPHRALEVGNRSTQSEEKQNISCKTNYKTNVLISAKSWSG